MKKIYIIDFKQFYYHTHKSKAFPWDIKQELRR